MSCCHGITQRSRGRPLARRHDEGGVDVSMSMARVPGCIILWVRRHLIHILLSLDVVVLCGEQCFALTGYSWINITK